MKSVLVTSIASKAPLLKVIQESMSLKNEQLKIIGTDSNQHIIARYFVDEFWQMPPLKKLSREDFLTYCQENNVNIIFPTREGELAYFSKHKAFFKQNGVYIMVSGQAELKRAQDKFLFYTYLSERDFPVIKTRLSIDEKDTGLYVVKERLGAGSLDLHLNVDSSKAIQAAKQMKHPIFQPFIEGTEFSIDVYTDQKGKSKGAVVRERVLVVNGESQITRTIRDVRLEQLGMELAETLGLHGHVMFQVIVDSNGSPHIVECNPRFGGASTLSVAAGLDSFYWFLLESQGESLENYPFIRSEKELTQVRYAKDMIF